MKDSNIFHLIKKWVLYRVLKRKYYYYHSPNIHRLQIHTLKLPERILAPIIEFVTICILKLTEHKINWNIKYKI